MSIGFDHQPDTEGFNCSFLTRPNMEWFYFIVNYLPVARYPLVFLPCASGAKTRSKNGRKMISDSSSHQLLSRITRNECFERVILSEPCTIIPYRYEGHPNRPDYNLPVSELSIQSERIFINQLALWLMRVKLAQPWRKYIYYVGATHHYLILKYGNLVAGNPFKIIYVVPKNGLRDYAKAARQLESMIYSIEDRHIEPELEPVDEEKWLASRGRYTNRRFWKEIITWHKEHSNQDFIEESIKVGDKQDWEQGFSQIYNAEKPVFPPVSIQRTILGK